MTEYHPGPLRTAATPPRARPVPVLLAVLVLLPAAAHWLAVGAHIFAGGHPLPAGRLDQVVTLLGLGYTVLAGAALRRFTFALRLFLATYALLLPTLAGELALRMLAPRAPFHLPWPPMQRHMQISTKEMPGLEPEVDFSVNRLGLRGPEVDLDAADLRILCVGGSTTECLYVSDKRSWPWRLQDKLASQLARKVFVGNAGHSGDYTPHGEYLLRHYELAPKFNFVVVLCGINDLGAWIHGRYEARLKNVPRETFRGDPEAASSGTIYYRRGRLAAAAQRVIGKFHQAKPPGAEALIQDSYGDWVRTRREMRAANLRSNPRSEPPANLGEGVRRYQEHLSGIIAACRQNKQTVVFLTQPTLYRADLSAEERSLLWQNSPGQTYTVEALEKISAAYNRGLLELCSQEGVNCLDLASLIPSDQTSHYDDCHFNVGGCERVAQVLANFFLTKLTPPSAERHRP